MNPWIVFVLVIVLVLCLMGIKVILNACNHETKLPVQKALFDQFGLHDSKSGEVIKTSRRR